MRKRVRDPRPTVGAGILLDDLDGGIADLRYYGDVAVCVEKIRREHEDVPLAGFRGAAVPVLAQAALRVERAVAQPRLEEVLRVTRTS